MREPGLSTIVLASVSVLTQAALIAAVFGRLIVSWLEALR